VISEDPLCPRESVRQAIQAEQLDSSIAEIALIAFEALVQGLPPSEAQELYIRLVVRRGF
jgi:hypothetical protein